MAYAVQHVHIKTRDPEQTSQFYMDNFGATMKAEIPGRGFRLDLHGLQLNITTLIDSQKHEQHYGIEHIAVQTDDYQGTLAKMKANGVRILEEMPPNNGRNCSETRCRSRCRERHPRGTSHAPYRRLAPDGRRPKPASDLRKCSPRSLVWRMPPERHHTCVWASMRIGGRAGSRSATRSAARRSTKCPKRKGHSLCAAKR
jgi:catechol 2,3-dioxygenase-like lactoylglutathione lyase family enzyme